MKRRASNRKGIICGGNWIVDHVKIVDSYPNEGMLTDIHEEFTSVGGGPNNVLVNLAKLNNDIPLYAMGILGDDADAEFVFNELSKYEIDISGLRKSDQMNTSYTDVMSVKETGHRTFFHSRGANSILDVKDFDLDTEARIFHLAYLLLLDRLDAMDEEYGVVAARVLQKLQQKGYKTSVDVVSSEGGRFRTILGSCLPYIDYLIINEIEAGLTTGRKIRTKNKGVNIDQLKLSALDLLKAGSSSLVIIHFPEGAFAINRMGDELQIPSFKVSEVEIKGTTGAGDAFCAGCLYAIHEGYPLDYTLKFAHACASFNLKDPTSTGGAVSLEAINSYITSYR